MSRIAMILAGGVGSRMQAEIPKQFLRVSGKPIIIHTLSVFENSDDIDGILVVCIKDWIEDLWKMAKKYNITKLKWVVPGGENGQGSARNGIFHLREFCKDDDIVVIHDAVRPLVTKSIISDCVMTCEEKGNACSAIPIQETVMLTSDGGMSGDTSINRENVIRVMTPQAYRFSMIYDAHKEALEKGITNSVYANTMIHELGGKIYFSSGSNFNIKLTISNDLDIFKGLLGMVNRDQ